MFNLPWTTHRYWIETISDYPHPKTVLSGRYVKFVKSLTTSNKCAVRYLSALCQDDRRTLLGRTLCKIGLDCGVAPSDLSANLVKSSLQYFPVPDDQQWRVPLLLELLDAHSDKMTIENLTSNQISDIIDNICTSWWAPWWWNKFSSWPPSFLFHKPTIQYHHSSHYILSCSMHLWTK